MQKGKIQAVFYIQLSAGVSPASSAQSAKRGTPSEMLNGVLYSMPVSDVLTFIISMAVVRYTFKVLSSESDPQQKKLTSEMS